MSSNYYNQSNHQNLKTTYGKKITSIAIYSVFVFSTK
ncbi:hypothetical protein FlaCF_3741 [Flavobacterium tructae]